MSRGMERTPRSKELGAKTKELTKAIRAEQVRKATNTSTEMSAEQLIDTIPEVANKIGRADRVAFYRRKQREDEAKAIADNRARVEASEQAIVDGVEKNIREKLPDAVQKLTRNRKIIRETEATLPEVERKAARSMKREERDQLLDQAGKLQGALEREKAAQTQEHEDRLARQTVIAKREVQKRTKPRPESSDRSTPEDGSTDVPFDEEAPTSVDTAPDVIALPDLRSDEQKTAPDAVSPEAGGAAVVEQNAQSEHEEPVADNALREDLLTLKRDFESNEPSPNSKAEYKAKLQALLDKYSPQSDVGVVASEVYTGEPHYPSPVIASNTLPEGPTVSVQEAAARAERRSTKQTANETFKKDFYDPTIDTEKAYKETYFDLLKAHQQNRGFLGALGERLGLQKGNQDKLPDEVQLARRQWVATRVMHARTLLDSIQERREGRGSAARQDRHLDEVIQAGPNKGKQYGEVMRERYQRMYVVKAAVFGAEESEQRARMEGLALRDRHLADKLFKAYNGMDPKKKIILGSALGVAGFAFGTLTGGIGAAALLSGSALGVASIGAVQRLRAQGALERGDTDAHAKLSSNAKWWSAAGIGGWLTGKGIETAQKKSSQNAEATLKKREVGDLRDANYFETLSKSRQGAAATLERNARLRSTGSAVGGIAAGVGAGALSAEGFSAVGSHIPHGVTSLEHSVTTHAASTHGGPELHSTTAHSATHSETPTIAPAGTHHAQEVPGHPDASAPSDTNVHDVHSQDSAGHSVSPEAQSATPGAPESQVGGFHHEIKAGEGATHMYADMLRQLHHQYPAGSTPPPLVQKMFEFHNVDQFARATGFEHFDPASHTVTSALVHPGDTLTLSPDGHTLTFTPAHGDPYTVMQESPQGAVVTHDQPHVELRATHASGAHHNGPHPTHESPTSAVVSETPAAESATTGIESPPTLEQSPDAPADSSGSGYMTLDERLHAVPSATPDSASTAPPETSPAPGTDSSVVHPSSFDLRHNLMSEYPARFTNANSITVDSRVPHIYSDTYGTLHAWGGKSYDELHSFAQRFAASQSTPVRVSVEGNPETLFAQRPDLAEQGIFRYTATVTGDGQGHSSLLNGLTDPATQLNHIPSPGTFSSVVS